MELQNIATLEMIKNIVGGTTPVDEAVGRHDGYVPRGRIYGVDGRNDQKMPPRYRVQPG